MHQFAGPTEYFSTLTPETWCAKGLRRGRPVVGKDGTVTRLGAVDRHGASCRAVIELLQLGAEIYRGARFIRGAGRAPMRALLERWGSAAHIHENPDGRFPTPGAGAENPAI